MIYVTGDKHGDQEYWEDHIAPFLKSGDTIVIAGDFGIGFFDGRDLSEELFFDNLAAQDYTILFCDGNHENFEKLGRYEISEWGGGKVQFIRPNVIHLMRGEIYTIDDKKIFVMGGANSADKHLRVASKSWWPQEMPSDEEYRNASKNLKNAGYIVDYILTHTAPENTVRYMSHMEKGTDYEMADELPLLGFLQWVEDTVKYDKWYFGHFHLDEELWKNQYVLFEGVRELFTGEAV